LAASALLALLLGPFLGPAAEHGLRTLSTVREELSPLARHTETQGREKLIEIQQTAATAEASARRAVTRSVHDVSDRLSERLSTFVHAGFPRRSR
jgi:hypothetical protein